MMYCGYIISYFDIGKISPPMSTNDTLITIANDSFFLLGESTFESFEFKKNKRGGESGKIKFVKMFGNYKINDRVEFTLEGQRVFTGVIQKIKNYGLELEVIPLWGLLDYVFFTGSQETEEDHYIYNILLSLEKKIISVGIGFKYKNIEHIKDSDVNSIIKSTLAGRSVRDILDELEGELPENYVYGVDASGEFYFKNFPELPVIDELVWHNGDFGESEYEEDYSELYSQYIVKIKDKDPDKDKFNVLKKIVGEGDATPEIRDLREKVGIKTGVFEYNYYITDDDAINNVTKLLKSQVPTQKIKLKNVNFKKNRLYQNAPYEILLMPINNFFEDIGIYFTFRKSTPSFLNTGEILKIGAPLGSGTKVKNHGSLSLTEQSEYLDVCNRALDIYEIELKYKTDSKADNDLFLITDGIKRITKYSKNKVLKVNIKGFNKRSIRIEALDLKDGSIVIFDKMRAFFTQGSSKLEMNMRSIKYKYGKGVITVDCELTKLNSVLTGYLFNQNKQLQKLEKSSTN